jgi:hypothetical protein
MIIYICKAVTLCFSCHSSPKGAISPQKKSFTKLIHIYITTNFHLLGYELQNYQKNKKLLLCSFGASCLQHEN